MGLTLPIAAGSNAKTGYGVRGIPSAALIGPDGKIVWTGHPGGLSKGVVKDALKGAKKRASGFLAIPAPNEVSSRLASAAKSMEAGDLAKARAAAHTVAEDANASENEREEAKGLVAAIDEHVALLNEQAEGFVKSLDLVRALLVYETLAKEFSGGEIGDTAKKRVDEIKKDEKLSKELDAAEAFDKVKAQTARLSTSKGRAKWEDFAEKFKGTRAGERAAAILRAGKK